MSYEQERGPGPEARSRGGQSRAGSKACRGPIKRGRKRVTREEEEVAIARRRAGGSLFFEAKEEGGS